MCLVLASGSPRRQALLRRMGIRFTVQPATDDGPVVQGSAAERVLGHARHKARQVAVANPDRPVLAADTMVFLASEALGKPADRAQARAMLEALVAAEYHQVWTGAVLRLGHQEAARADMAEVRFRPIPAARREAYLDGEEWQDKAGANAIQGWAGSYAEVIRGWPGTVVGLAQEAVEALYRDLRLPLPSAGG